MIKKFFPFFLLVCSFTGFGQVIVINEIDSDTPSIDSKEFVELKTQTPNFSLNGYVLVCFNGNPNSGSNTALKSYFTMSLDGLTSDANGIVLVGNNDVSPYPARTFGDNILQNGADAIAVYSGGFSDFPDGTLATTTNLIHAVAYDTSDDDAIELMTLLGLTVQYNENENNQQATHSIQRKNDGTYEAKLPTPGVPNDGSGVVFNGVTLSVPATQYNEGTTIPITITTETPSTTEVVFTFTLNNSSFNANDFSGNTIVTMPQGQTSFTTFITIIDDTEDEGDEIMKIKFGSLPTGYVKLNDNISIEIIDNDYQVAAWGTPLNPTYGIVLSTAPADYYNSLEGKSGAELKQAIQDIIANPSVVRAHNYGDVNTILKTADQNPLNSNEVWLMYKEVPRSKLLIQTTGNGVGKWNREHIYPQSRGGFTDGTADTPDGINVWEVTNANMLVHGHSDAHHLRAEDATENSTRNNKDYGLTDYNGFTGNAGSWKGDVARAVFYMSIRYNGLDVVNGNLPDTTVGQLGDLATLLTWNTQDPADDFEMNRNNYIYTWQVNRNPFIDYPQLANYIWGANAGQTWFASLATSNYQAENWTIYPNPASNYFNVTGIEQDSTLDLINVSGQIVLSKKVAPNQPVYLNVAAGIYFAKIKSGEKELIKKVIVN
ncbi:endonuclease [Flavobacterium sp.]|uniref:endonuclease I family protein n=1 Tax=Flavobacterium sp. TaxID=239 RepID=UPI002604E0A2|nr:endonuclease [Flavobacterium sp.]MDD3004418.1 endonuclease [Flavobacterium sp.]